MKKLGFKGKFKKFLTFDENYEYEEEVRVKEMDIEPANENKSKNVISLSAVQQPTSKVVLCEPQSYDEVQGIADHLLNKRAVVINLQRVDHVQAKRIVDFLSGTVYAIKGDIQKLGMETFLCTPENVDVSGTITNDIFTEQDIEKGW